MPQAWPSWPLFAWIKEDDREEHCGFGHGLGDFFHRMSCKAAFRNADLVQKLLPCVSGMAIVFQKLDPLPYLTVSR